MSFALSDADVYFARGNHTLSHVWEQFDEDQKTEGLATAKRILSRFLRQDVTELTTLETDYHEPTYAVFEQALFECYVASSPNSELSGAKYLKGPQNPVDMEMSSGKGGLYDEALKWLPNVDLPPMIMRG